MMDAYLPLIQTIVGGLLAVTGGFIANILLQKKNLARESRDLRRQKLEELYECSSAVEEVVGQLVVFWSTYPVTKANAPSFEDGKAALGKLKLIVFLYHSELRSEVNTLEKVVDGFYRSVSQYAETVLEKKAPMPDLFKMSVNDPAEAVRAARQSLIEATEQLAPKYV
jgi:hypothetical protein